MDAVFFHRAAVRCRIKYLLDEPAINCLQIIWRSNFLSMVMETRRLAITLVNHHLNSHLRSEAHLHDGSLFENDKEQVITSEPDRFVAPGACLYPSEPADQVLFLPV